MQASGAISIEKNAIDLSSESIGDEEATAPRKNVNYSA